MPRIRAGRPHRIVAAAIVAVLLLEGPATATPPSPPLDLDVRLVESPAGGGSGRFEIDVEPRVEGTALRVRVRAPRDVALSGLAPLVAVDRPAARHAHRLTGRIRGPRNVRHHVEVVAELDVPGGHTWRRATSFSWLDGVPAVAEPAVRIVPDGAGGRLAAFDGAGAHAPRTSAGRSDGVLAVWTASGRFLYRDRVQDANGFTGAEPDLPARFVDEQVVDATTSAILAQGATDANGDFALPVTDTQVRTVQVRMTSLSANTPGLLLDVRNNATQRLPWAVNGGSVAAHDPSADVDFGTTTALAGAGAEAFNVFDVLLDGFDFWATLNGGARPPIRLTAYWQAGSVDGTYFNRATNSVHLRGVEGWDDTVIGHEQGHWVSSNWSNDDTPGGTHYIGDNFQDIRLAWSEGFATFWGCAVRRAYGRTPSGPLYVDTHGTPGAGNLNFSFEVEGPDVPALGAANEVAVAGALWDLVDDAASPDATPGLDDDALARPVADPWDVIENRLPLPGVSNVSLEDFWDGWFQPGFSKGSAAEVAAAFDALSIRYVPDAFEPDDAIAQAAVVATNGEPQFRTFYGFGDVDHARFTTTPGAVYVVETTDLLSDGNTHLTVLGPDQSTVVAANDDRSPLDPSSRVEFTAGGPGPYYARLVHAADLGIYGTYALRVLRPSAATLAGVPFTERAAAAGLANVGSGRGCAWGDADGDGDPDLFVANLGGTAALYRNDGGTFVDRAAAWGLAIVGDTQGAAWCDHDDDGDLDLFVVSTGPARLLQNRRADTGDSVFVDVTAASGLARTHAGRSCAWVDADRDGVVDLSVTDAAGATALFRGDGDGTYTDVSAQAGFGAAGRITSVAWCDFDRDGDDDAFLASPDGASRLLVNRLREDGGLAFVDGTAPAGLPAGSYAYAAEWGDFDGDGRFDLHLASAGAENVLARNRGDGTFEDVAGARNAAGAYYSTVGAFADVDNDADLDLFVGNLVLPGLVGVNRLALNSGGQFLQTAALASSGATQAGTFADADGDGDLDLHLAMGNGQPDQFWRNDGSNPNALAVRLLGRVSDRDGFGATLRARTGGKVQWRQVTGGAGFGSQHHPAAWFGLGGATSVDSLVVDWPSGRRSTVLGVPAGALLVDEADAVDVPRAGAPDGLALAAPAPLPAPGGRTRLAFTVPAAGTAARVRLALHDVAGRRVRALVDASLPPGPHALAFDGKDDAGTTLRPGVYFLALEANGARAARKLVVVDR